MALFSRGRVELLRPNCLFRVPTVNTITLSIKLHRELRGDKYSKSTALTLSAITGHTGYVTTPFGSAYYIRVS